MCRWKNANSCVDLLSNKWPQTVFCSHMTPDCCLTQYRAQFEGLIDQRHTKVTVDFYCCLQSRARIAELALRMLAEPQE